jgi:hypothetical protein
MPDPLLAEPDLTSHLGYILAEEEALKTYLTGYEVPKRPGSPEKEPVRVWYRWPEGERVIKYPYITIDLLTAEPNYELFTSTYFQDTTNLYRPSISKQLPPPPDLQGWRLRNFLAMRLVWQVAHYARSSLHDRYLTSIFGTDVFPPRPFWIEVEADGVAKRTELLSFQAADTMETTESGTKRIFRKIYTVSMLTEIPQERLVDNAVYTALRVLIPVVAREQFDSYRNTILASDDPMSDFTDEERAQAGEYFTVAHEGIDTPTAE